MSKIDRVKFSPILVREHIYIFLYGLVIVWIVSMYYKSLRSRVMFEKILWNDINEFDKKESKFLLTEIFIYFDKLFEEFIDYLNTIRDIQVIMFKDFESLMRELSDSCNYIKNKKGKKW